MHHLHGWRARAAASRQLLFAAWMLRHNLTVPDAIYVVLARQLGAVLVTGDRRLAAAPRLGVTVHTPSERRSRAAVPAQSWIRSHPALRRGRVCPSWRVIGYAYRLWLPTGSGR